MGTETSSDDSLIDNIAYRAVFTQLLKEYRGD